MPNDVFITSKRGGLKDVYYNILKTCPLKLKAYIEILRVHHKIYSDKNPKYFSEKIQWLKIHHKLEQFTTVIPNVVIASMEDQQQRH